MYKLAAAFALLAGPALAAGLEIDVAGEANGTIVIDLFEDVAPLHVAQITTIEGQQSWTCRNRWIIAWQYPGRVFGPQLCPRHRWYGPFAEPEFGQ